MELPAVLDKFAPEVVVKEAIQLNAKVDCNLTVCSIKVNSKTQRRTVSFELEEAD